MKSDAQTPLPQSPQWNALVNHFKAIEGTHLREMFAQDPRRGETFSVEGAGLYLDYSKNRITAETMELLICLLYTSPSPRD